MMTCLINDAANKEVSKRLRLSGEMIVAGSDDIIFVRQSEMGEMFWNGRWKQWRFLLHTIS